MDEHIFSFPPILSAHPNILILGTMPSAASLQAGEYYAHPSNAFWKIMSTIKGIDCPTTYEEKKQLIVSLDLALWDVCHTCIRPGSADSDIRQEEPNAIRELLSKQPTIHTIIFNGQTAEKLFRRHLKQPEGIRTITMPSTSPAYTLPVKKKLAVWRQTIDAEQL
ncbi:MAG: DNA-deoxyinosine glycosylase [Bacteroidota bacterium]|nr:DNA-deoxyinosine glycosylase [Bacteroidota bacterium]